MKILRFGVFILLILALSGCYSPLSKWFKAEKKIDQTEEKIQVNSDKTVDLAKSYVYGTKLTLDLDPLKLTNKYTRVASELNDRAVAVLGIPELEEIIVLRQMVTNLLSENIKNVIKGEQELANMDAKVIELQAEKKELGLKLENAEKKLSEIGAANASLAQKWQKLKNYFWYCVWGVAIYFILKILTQVLPPPYNAISGVLGMPISLVIKMVQGICPDIKKYAGVVSEKVHVESEETLKQIVDVIQQVKTQKPEVFKEISPFLKEATSDKTRLKINRTKEAIGYF